MPLLELLDLVYRVDHKKILNELNLKIEASEVHALLGTNGTGKSTLACLVLGCEGYVPTSGNILFEGNPIQSFTISERAQLGITMAWQEPVRFEGITVEQYLCLRNRDLEPAPYLAMVGLQPERYLTRMVDRSLSGGERKRIELASVLALRPKLAILDEPGSGIDMLSIGDIVSVIRAFRDNGSAVLLISHREEIAAIADTASQICDGRIVCTGTPARVAEHYRSRSCTVCNGEECR